MTAQQIKVVLVDVNPKMVAAWREVFEDNPEVTVVQGSMLDQKVDAWVSPTNAKGEMAGGLDGVIKKHFGPKIQTRVQSEIAKNYKGSMPVGSATCASGESAGSSTIALNCRVASRTSRS